jgi:hypothetical protein
MSGEAAEPRPLPVTASRSIRRVMTAPRSDEHHRSEIEMMKRDNTEKEAQIADLQRTSARLQSLTKTLVALILDLEPAIGERLLPDDVRASDRPSPHVLVSAIRAGIHRTVQLHAELPQRYEADFAAKAPAALAVLEAKLRATADVSRARLAMEEELRRVERQIALARAETESVGAIAGRLELQLAVSSAARERAAMATGRQIDAVRGAIAGVRESLPARAAALEKARHDAAVRPPRRALVAARDAPGLRGCIENARENIAREVAERDVVDEELVHVRQEIERAHAMINRFRASLTPAQQEAADATNAQLRHAIEAQREEFKHAIAVQKKKNQELERQKRELAEEEALLTSVMRGLEKKAQAQAHRLPSLAEVQQRQSGTAPPRRPTTALRPADDAEMRNVRKTMAQFRSQRVASKAALVGSPDHPV